VVLALDSLKNEVATTKKSAKEMLGRSINETHETEKGLPRQMSVQPQRPVMLMEPGNRHVTFNIPSSSGQSPQTSPRSASPQNEAPEPEVNAYQVTLDLVRTIQSSTKVELSADEQAQFDLMTSYLEKGGVLHYTGKNLSSVLRSLEATLNKWRIPVQSDINKLKHWLSCAPDTAHLKAHDSKDHLLSTWKKMGPF